MEKFSIDDEDSEELELNPVFLSSVPKYQMEKGVVIERHAGELFECTLFKERKGLMGLFLESKQKVNRLIGFEIDYLYAFAEHRQGLIVKEVWNLRRLYKLEICKENHQIITLLLVNKSLRPADSIKAKKIQVTESRRFLNSLQAQLSLCDIDLEL